MRSLYGQRQWGGVYIVHTKCKEKEESQRVAIVPLDAIPISQLPATGTATITKVGPGAVNSIFTGAGAAADPAFLAIAASQFAATNAAGTLASRAFSIVKQVFTSTGTYTPTTGMLYCDVIVIGGGGAGGGGAITGATTTSLGSGGGGGDG